MCLGLVTYATSKVNNPCLLATIIAWEFAILNYHLCMKETWYRETIVRIEMLVCRLTGNQQRTYLLSNQLRSGCFESH